MATEQEKTIAGLQTSIQMEIDGKEFYLKSSQSSRNQLGQKLLKQLAAEEDVHLQTFEKIYDAIRRQKAWPRTDYHPDAGRGLRTIFAKALQGTPPDANPLATELEAVQTAMKMENKTYDFYKERSRAATYGAEKDFYEAVASQEQEHHRVLLDYYEFLKNPAAWFIQKEHPSLDGG
jgi:rubrerythrin